MKIKSKLLLLTLCAIVGMLLNGGIGLKNALDGGESIHSIGNGRIPKIKNLLLVNVSTIELVRRSYQIASLNHLPYEQQIEELRRLVEKLEQTHAATSQHIADYEALPRLPEAQRIWERFTGIWETFFNYDRDYLAQSRSAVLSPSPEKLDALYRHVIENNLQRRHLTEQIDAITRELVEMNDKLTGEEIGGMEASSRTSTLLQAVVLTIMVVVMISLFVSLNVSVIKPVEHTRNLIVQVEREQNLKLRTHHIAHDEIGQLSEAFDAMLGKLQSSLQTVHAKMQEVNHTVAELDNAAKEVTAGSSAQSSSTSAMAAAVEEMTVSISTVSGSAVDAQNVAHEAGDTANQGGAIIEQTVTEMSNISSTVSQASSVIESLGHESQQISSVVQVIKEVADQTNLLALNAAIEAARAGEQGRGFAVVADEVRKLAERTSQSTSDISGMVGKIQTSAKEAVAEMVRVVKQVESGQILAQDAGKRISAIRESASKVAQAVSEISSALKEQSAASQDIARNVENVAQMTDQNAAAAITASDYTERLKQLTLDVKNTVEQFKV
ncbi:MAG: methyl-accepting chemotaxis protein [Azoarcus sp.]|jgi:methyl-accepting chemotaxis protein|nr:methyl-accepting chemotaxis protein [Azoarcus sp.]